MWAVKALDYFVRAVGQLGIWAFAVFIWALEIVIKIAWTCFVAAIEFVVILVALVFTVKHYKR